MRHDRPTALLVALLALGTTVLLLTPSSPGAADQGAGSAALGRSLYRSYCASCHGAAARGDGTLADSLDPRPIDLTRLAAGNGGVFPTERVAQSIDGRTAQRGHRSEMPKWGNVFAAADPQADEAAIAGKVADLVAFLATLQAEG